MKKTNVLFVLAVTFLLTGCLSRGNKTSSASNSIVATSSDSLSDDNNLDTDITEDVTVDGDKNDFDNVNIPEESVAIPGSYDSFSDGTISASGNYYLKGNYSAISITAAKNSVVYVFLDGATISSSEGVAFGSEKQIVLHLVLLNNSENTITNDFLDTNAFHVKGNVLISGLGTLNLESKQKSGLKVSKDLYIYPGVTINSKGNAHAITARSITSKGATLNVTSETKDGLQTEVDSDVTEYTSSQGFIHLVDTNVTADTYGDGVQADTYVYISGGTHNITTHGEFVSYSSENMTTYELETDDFKYIKSGQDYKRVAKDEIRNLSSAYYALKTSVKGIKAGAIEVDGSDASGNYEIYIAHLATVNISSYDDCVHTNLGDVTIDSANLELSTYDDGLHADYDLVVNNASIGVSKSYEGLEGANVTINGENTNLVLNSSDDGINAASDLVSSTTLTVNAGYLRVYASGDGLDANTALNLNGGTVIVEGPGSGNGSLDANQINFNGGIIMAYSTSGMTERMSAKQYTFLYQGSNIAYGTLVGVVDSSGNTLYSYTLKQSCNQIIFSHPSMAANQTYKLMAGSNVLASITMTSTLVTSGTSSGGPGGGGHGPGGW